MSSRRDVLRAMLAAGALGREFGSLLPNAQETQVAFSVPDHACDCHTHIFDPQHFPYIAERTRTPPAASIAELNALHQRLRLSRVVLVQPSTYGTDNACMADALRRIGDRARGVAVAEDKTTDATLDQLHALGVRGLRVNVESPGTNDPAEIAARFREAVSRARPRGWHVQLYARLSVIEALSEQIGSAGIPVVVDHFGLAQANSAASQSGVRVLHRLLQGGALRVKISAPYLISTAAPDYRDVAPLARSLVDANPRGVLWGSNWPHPGPRVEGRPLSEITPARSVDDVRIFNLLQTWIPSHAIRQLVLVDNAERTYQF